jgi:hypothetical protein
MPNTEHAIACKSTDHGVVGNIFVLLLCSSILFSHPLGLCGGHGKVVVQKDVIKKRNYKERIN